MADFTMPSLGADMETGKLVEWRVEPGARVRSGDVVAVVETHKGAIDVEIFLDGLIDDLALLGAELPVGAVLAHVRADGEPAAAPASAASTPVVPEAQPAPAPARLAMVPAQPAAAGVRTSVSPAARRRASELGVDADLLSGSGGDGAVTLADVERAAAQPRAGPAGEALRGAAPAPRSGFDPTQMRQAIAAAMSRSKREIPHYYLTTTVDFHAAQAWLEAFNAERTPAERLLPATLLLKASALALRRLPQFNGFFADGAFRAGAGVHVGWAIALRGGGLIAPAIHDADRKSLPELMSALRDLVQRARAGGLRSSELSDPTITVTSLGERGAEGVLGVIYPPQVAIIGFGCVLQRPWVVDGQIAARPLLALSLAADHRVSDGHLGGQLLAAIDDALQEPGRL